MEELSVYNSNRQNELQRPNTNTAPISCVWCQRRLGRGRCHSVSEGPERHFISERISPRQVSIYIILRFNNLNIIYCSHRKKCV